MRRQKPYESRQPRKLIKIKHSKYEASEALHGHKNYWSKVFDEMDTTSKAPSQMTESRSLLEVLPTDLYRKVCSILNLPVLKPEEAEPEPIEEVTRRYVKEPLFSYRKTLHIDREMDSDTDVEYEPSDNEEVENVHFDLLKKPEREQITWDTHYLKPERDDEKSLVTKANDITDRIAMEFCHYMTELGGDKPSQLFKPEAIRELFQIDYDTPIARGVRVVPKELPTVIEKIAYVTGHPQKSQYAVLQREVSKDIQTERVPDKILGFSTSLPRQEQWHSPCNDTENTWRSSRFIPKDLVTLKTVWEGITNLKSVREYCRWMMDHPEHRRAPYLSSLGLFDAAVLDARLTMELNRLELSPRPASPSDTPAPVDQIRRKLSELAETS